MFRKVLPGPPSPSALKYVPLERCTHKDVPNNVSHPGAAALHISPPTAARTGSLRAPSEEGEEEQITEEEKIRQMFANVTEEELETIRGMARPLSKWLQVGLVTIADVAGVP